MAIDHRRPPLRGLLHSRGPLREAPSAGGLSPRRCLSGVTSSTEMSSSVRSNSRPQRPLSANGCCPVEPGRVRTPAPTRARPRGAGHTRPAPLPGHPPAPAACPGRTGSSTGSSRSRRGEQARTWRRSRRSWRRRSASVGEPDPAFGDQFGDHQLNAAEVRRQPARPAVVLGLVGRVRKEPGQQLADHPEELAVRAEPGRRRGDRQRDQLPVGDPSSGPAARLSRASPRTRRLR
jgi:hypothetical protein